MQGQPTGVPQSGSAPQAYAGASAGEPRLPSPTEVKLHSLQQHAEQLQGMWPHLCAASGVSGHICKIGGGCCAWHPLVRAAFGLRSDTARRFAGADESTRRAMEQRSLGHAMHTHLVEFLRSFLRTPALEVSGLPVLYK